MKVIKSEPYNYRIIEEDASIYIYVLCGASAAMFEKKVKLELDTVDEIMSNEESLTKFLGKIRDN